MIASGVSRAADMAAHHIIATGSTSDFAAKARKILQDNFGTHSINFAFNGVFLPKNLSVSLQSGSEAAVHSTLHTNSYYKRVYEIIQEASVSDDPYLAIVEALESIAAQLSKGTFSRGGP